MMQLEEAIGLSDAHAEVLRLVEASLDSLEPHDPQKSEGASGRKKTTSAGTGSARLRPMTKGDR